VPAGFRALRHDGRRSGVQRLVYVPQALNLAEQLRAAGVDPFGERPGIAERQEHAQRLVLQRLVEHVRRLGERPADEAHAHMGAGGQLHLLSQIGLVAERAGVGSAHEAQTAGLRHGGGEPSPGYERHRRAHHGVAHAEGFSESRLHGH
jgi:hypothetical protein